VIKEGMARNRNHVGPVHRRDTGIQFAARKLAFDAADEKSAAVVIDDRVDVCQVIGTPSEVQRSQVVVCRIEMDDLVGVAAADRRHDRQQNLAIAESPDLLDAQVPQVRGDGAGSPTHVEFAEIVVRPEIEVSVDAGVFPGIASRH